MRGPAKLTPALIESLFEPVVPLYPDSVAELAGVASGDKACAFDVFEAKPDDRFAERIATWRAAFLAGAKALALPVTRRELPFEDRPMDLLVATRAGEEWRAEVIQWEFRTRLELKYRSSERSEYLRSRAFGYTHEQAVAWVERDRHYTPVHARDAIYLFLPFALAKQITEEGRFPTRGSFLIAIPPGIGVYRDVLDRLPAGFAVGRAAFDWKVIYPLIKYQPRQTQIAELKGIDLAQSFVSPVDYWDGQKWSSRPTQSTGAIARGANNPAVPRQVADKRIVLYGPPLVGKTTILEAVANEHRSSVETIYMNSSDGVPCRGARTRFARSGREVEIATLVGPTQTKEIWRALLENAAAVVLVLDGQRERAEANLAWASDLPPQSTAGCVIVTKLDLPNATFDAAQLKQLQFANWPVVRIRRGALAPAVQAIHAVIDRP